MAQDITSVRDINAIPQAQLDILNAGGENLMAGDITANIYNELNGTEVTIVVVLMSDPKNSGLGNVTDGRPSRVHMFGRDTSSVSLGNDGMGIQIVDGAWDTNNLLSFARGDVVQITGNVSPFGTTMQISPNSLTLLGSYTDLGLPASILDPVVVTTDEVNMAVGVDDGVQTNWDNLARLRNQFVRVEGATLQARDLFTNPDRPDFHISSDGGTTIMNFYDTGIQFRNDRGGDYPDTFNNDNITGLDDFEPPPPGSVVNMQGFLVFQAFANSIGRSVPADAILSIAPFERRGCDGTEGFRCDLEVTETPPVISNIMGPDFVPDGSADVTISFGVEADPSRSITGSSCTYFTSEDATEMMVSATQNGDAWECTIPAQGDGVFTTYWTSSTDNTGAVSTSDQAAYRTLVDGINSIEDIQLTIDGGPGDSPFSGVTTAMAITAYVVSDPATSGIVVIQDDVNLDPWTGVLVDNIEDGAVAFGDMVSITEARVEERFGVTQIDDVVWSVVSSGNAVPDYKTVTTDVLVDDNIAEAHEGMMLRFENVVITNNDAGFGEWAFSSDGTDDNALFADDNSNDIASDFAAMTWAGGERLAFLRGIWWFSFGNYKLVPETAADIGDVTNVANEDDGLPNRFALEQNFPNPFNPSTSIDYAVPATGHVTLEVFDLLGRQVRSLVDGSLPAGDYTVTFNAGNLPSGLYLYRLTTSGKSVTKQMVLLK